MVDGGGDGMDVEALGLEACLVQADAMLLSSMVRRCSVSRADVLASWYVKLRPNKQTVPAKKYHGCPDHPV